MQFLKEFIRLHDIVLRRDDITDVRLCDKYKWEMVEVDKVVKKKVKEKVKSWSFLGFTWYKTLTKTVLHLEKVKEPTQVMDTTVTLFTIYFKNGDSTEITLPMELGWSLLKEAEKILNSDVVEPV